MAQSADVALLSVLVLHYNNGNVIYETLESIVTQTYPHIEVVICDDCSDEFSDKDVEAWMKEHSGTNIENVIVHKNEKNVGTVRNMEIALSLSRGDIITQIAADDTYYSETVFETFVNRLEELGPEAMFLTGQAAMMDIHLKKTLYDFVADTDKRLIEECSTDELFEKVSGRCFIPAVNFWRRPLMDTLGTFSDRYKLIEDWTKSLRMLRNGVRIYYLDEYLLKHRDGGVSHGNKKGTSKSYTYYVNDYIQAFRHEIFPYMESFSEESIDDVIRNYSWWSSVSKSFDKVEEEKEEVEVEEKEEDKKEKECEEKVEEEKKEEPRLVRVRRTGPVTKLIKRVLLYTINILRSIYDTICKKTA